ncbi:cutinase-domain-containing protein [Xylariomycetidae sp. FL2044]|nr:cutinase-domain-containing protein [Xylariomycetidae sp. FL2044]
MKFLYATVGLATLAVATPTSAASSLQKRQFWMGGTTTGQTANEYTQYGCRDVIFIFARGSGEPGNLGYEVGPGVSNGLKSQYGDSNVATEGVDYAAAFDTNVAAGGTSDTAGIQEMHDLLSDAASKCPDSKIVAGGYSQGAALTHRAIEDLPDSVKDAIVGAVTFGDTQNQQDGGRIPNFPTEKTLVICNDGDLVCSGSLTITAAHLDYGKHVDEAVKFLVGKIGGA